ncbi:MAG: hypothetical protein HY817_04290 [Candidatus Abawacabacteria bacterium]|nr:hypothetical protein [Candidatus Abawacabacteria bacterium]
MPTSLTCTLCHSAFALSDTEIAFLDRLSPIIANQKFPLPNPTQCPNCRLIGRVINRNEQFLYNTKSAQSGKDIIALYSADSPASNRFKVYTQEEWWEESMDPLSYGREYDFSRPFFAQYADLHLSVPKPALNQVSNENSPYTTGTGYCKNCHLINSSEYCQDCYYGKLIQSSRDIMDSCYIYDSELCYQCFYLTKCYGCNYTYYSQNCTECYFSDNLKGCKNCFLCTNLDNKQYYFLNEPLEKDAYIAKVHEFLGSKENITKALALFTDLRKKRIYKYANITNCESSTGDFLTNCQNCIDCYDTNDSQDCQHVIVGVEIKDVMDCSNVYVKPELNYQVMGALNTYQVLFGIYVFNSQNILYSQFCYNSNNLFGCNGMKKNEYCILNKQYSKSEYEALVPKIIAHMKSTQEWGEFFPPTLSPFSYNETVANEYLPLTQEAAQKRGYSWKEKNQKDYQPQNYHVPSKISEVKDDILQAILACSTCGKNYRILPQELRKLRDTNFPIPEKCPDCRHSERMSLRNPRKLYERQCSNCSLSIISPFAPTREEKVYCEQCYLQNVL